MGITATRSSTTEPMLVGDACVMMNFHDPRDRRDAMVLTRADAFVESSPRRAAAARPGNFISRHRSLARSCRGDWASSPDVVELAVSLWASSLRDDGGCSGEFSSLWPLTRHGTWPIVINTLEASPARSQIAD